MYMYSYIVNNRVPQYSNLQQLSRVLGFRSPGSGVRVHTAFRSEIVENEKGLGFRVLGFRGLGV